MHFEHVQMDFPSYLLLCFPLKKALKYVSYKYVHVFEIYSLNITIFINMNATVEQLTVSKQSQPISYDTTMFISWNKFLEKWITMMQSVWLSEFGVWLNRWNQTWVSYQQYLSK